MTQTVQPFSSVQVGETGKDLTKDKGEAEDDLSYMLSVFDNLNNLCESLSRLEYLIERKKIEQILNHKNKGEKKRNENQS